MEKNGEGTTLDTCPAPAFPPLRPEPATANGPGTRLGESCPGDADSRGSPRSPRTPLLRGRAGPAQPGSGSADRRPLPGPAAGPRPGCRRADRVRMPALSAAAPPRLGRGPPPHPEKPPPVAVPLRASRGGSPSTHRERGAGPAGGAQPSPAQPAAAKPPSAPQPPLATARHHRSPLPADQGNVTTLPHPAGPGSLPLPGRAPSRPPR